jgi:hypothetical protein
MGAVRSFVAIESPSSTPATRNLHLPLPLSSTTREERAKREHSESQLYVVYRSTDGRIRYRSALSVLLKPGEPSRVLYISTDVKVIETTRTTALIRKCTSATAEMNST